MKLRGWQRTKKRDTSKLGENFMQKKKQIKEKKELAQDTYQGGIHQGDVSESALDL